MDIPYVYPPADLRHILDAQQLAIETKILEAQDAQEAQDAPNASATVTLSREMLAAVRRELEKKNYSIVYRPDICARLHPQYEYVIAWGEIDNYRDPRTGKRLPR
jgi:hypothetical protein